MLETEGRLRIAVAGGSIGGLCAGLALHGAGFDVQVYERISGPMETRGAGIVVQGDLVELLRTHGADALPTTQCRGFCRKFSPSGCRVYDQTTGSAGWMVTIAFKGS